MCDDEKRVLSVMNALIYIHAHMFIRLLINMSYEDNHTHFLTNDMLAGGSVGSTGSNTNHNIDDEGYQAPPRSTMLRTISVLEHCAHSRDLLSSSIHTILYIPQR